MKITIVSTGINPIAALRFKAGSRPEGSYAKHATTTQQIAANNNVNRVLVFGIRMNPVINAPAIAPIVLTA